MSRDIPGSHCRVMLILFWSIYWLFNPIAAMAQGAPTILGEPMQGTTGVDRPPDDPTTPVTQTPLSPEQQLQRAISGVTAELESTDNDFLFGCADRYRPLNLDQMAGVTMNTMRPYLQDYKDDFEFEMLLTVHPLRKATRQAQYTLHAQDVALNMAFAHPGHDDRLREHLRAEQEKAALIQHALRDEVLPMLSQAWTVSSTATDTTTGIPMPEKPPLADPNAPPPENPPPPRILPPRVETRRWIAHYQFVRARVLAKIIWSMEYNLALGRLRGDITPPQANQIPVWVVSPRNERDSSGRWRLGQGQERYVREYLIEWQRLVEQIRTDHPGTPWAILAQRELAMPISVTTTLRNVTN